MSSKGGARPQSLCGSRECLSWGGSRKHAWSDISDQAGRLPANQRAGSQASLLPTFDARPQILLLSRNAHGRDLPAKGHDPDERSGRPVPLRKRPETRRARGVQVSQLRVGGYPKGSGETSPGEADRVLVPYTRECEPQHNPGSPRKVYEGIFAAPGMGGRESVFLSIRVLRSEARTSSLSMGAIQRGSFPERLDPQRRIL